VDHSDHVALIRPGVEDHPGVWADLGSGTGAFTLALADVLGGRGSIVSVDRDAGALEQQRREMERYFPASVVRYVTADFTRDLALSSLDGVLMANSLHFVRDRDAALRRIVAMLKPGGRFLLVEYDADRGNPWVPHPLSFTTWAGLAATVGLANTRQAGRVPSRFLNAIYSAVSERSM
jgi:ubiquinone/menaquinone biosynthesis C-methylase UbiE